MARRLGPRDREWCGSRSRLQGRVGDLAAHQISTASLIALLAAFFRILERRWPIPSRRSAFLIGGTWLALTVLFEFGFGHYVDGKSWSKLLENYDLTDGHIWILTLIWIAVGPAGVREFR